MTKNIEDIDMQKLMDDSGIWSDKTFGPPDVYNNKNPHIVLFVIYFKQIILGQLQVNLT